MPETSAAYGSETAGMTMDWTLWSAGPLPRPSYPATMRTMTLWVDTPLEEWHSGKVRRVRPSVLLLEREQIFDLDGKQFFAMGGASSHDIKDGILEPDDPLFEKKFWMLSTRGAAFRVNHQSWWQEELPSEAEYQEAMDNLDRVDWTVDYIITHCAPTSIQNALLRGLSKPDALTDFLEEIRQRGHFKYHFFGHYHTDQVIQQKYVLLYEQIIRLK